jgi:hypothetical protein
MVPGLTGIRPDRRFGAASGLPRRWAKMIELTRRLALSPAVAVPAASWRQTDDARQWT